MKRVLTLTCLWSFALAVYLAAQAAQPPTTTAIPSNADHTAAMKEAGPLSTTLTNAIQASNEADAAKAAARLEVLFADVYAYWSAQRLSPDDSALTAAQNAGTALDVISKAVAEHNMAAAAQANRMLQVMCNTCHADHGDRLPDSWFGAAGVWSGVYTEAQAKRGEQISNHSWCTSCHGPALAGNEAPPLVGEEFFANWNTQSLGDLFEKIHTTMPADAPGTLSLQETSDVVARVLQLNKFPAGQQELATDIDVLSRIKIENRPPPK